MIFRLLSIITATCLALAGAANAQGKAELLWYSQAAFKLTTPGGKVIMIDPWIMGATKIPPELKDLGKIGKVDLVLVTHGHGDHLGDAIEISKTNNAPLWAPAGLNQMLLTLGLMPANLVPRMNKGGIIEPFPGVKITMVRAEHSSEMLLKDPVTGKNTTYSAGEPVGFIIELENGFKIYHMGDTGLFGDMKLIGDYYKPDLLLVPIGGHYVMNPKDAAYATKELIKPKMAWPMHYASNPFLKGTPAEYKAALGQTSIQVIDAEPGTKKQF
ncbi:metal-dependent hydrolase [Reyranella sp.]|uniref:metal-dependent hydrolase n=1 Tax=Reyranella sp. TaxID=1929291 RepID=UPI0025DF2D30|nr:metal-dependent hydrolase [Reyranella sp.]